MATVIHALNRGGETSSAPTKPTDTKDRELSWLSERVEKGRKGPFVEITAITPTIAKRLLELNDGNRNLSEKLVQEIAADIEHGFWTLNGETIIVSKDGLLNDGQHRLEAVVRTGIAIQSAVMFGVAREARMTVDMGRQRTPGNFLSMAGTIHANEAAAVSKLLIFYEKGIFTSNGSTTQVKPGSQPTKQEIRDFYHRHQKDIDSAIRETINQKFSVLAGKTPIGAAYYILHNKNPVQAGVFFARLFDGANLKQNDSILWLRSRMMAERKSRLRGHEKLEIILRHWNRWRNDGKVTRNIPREGFYPKVER